MSEKKNGRLFKTLFHEKPAMMLIAIKNSGNSIYASHIAKKVDCTYGHVVKIIQEWEKEGLVKPNKQGRTKLLTLTKRGVEIASKIEEIQKML